MILQTYVNIILFPPRTNFKLYLNNKVKDKFNEKDKKEEEKLHKIN